DHAYRAAVVAWGVESRSEAPVILGRIVYLHLLLRRVLLPPLCAPFEPHFPIERKRRSSIEVFDRPRGYRGPGIGRGVIGIMQEFPFLVVFSSHYVYKVTQDRGSKACRSERHGSLHNVAVGGRVVLVYLVLRSIFARITSHDIYLAVESY